MNVEISCCSAADVAGMRELYQHECNCQLITYSMVPRGLADSWRITVDGELAGHGAVWNRHFPGRVSEFYVLPSHRSLTNVLFQQFIQCASPTEIGAQTNVPPMLTLLYAFCKEIWHENYLFQHSKPAGISISGGKLSASPHEPNEWTLDVNGTTMGKGGILHHYNVPYSDLYMEVLPEFRSKGMGSYLVQQLASLCWQMGRIPCARCNTDNVASRKTLERAGLACCGHYLAGRIEK